MRRLLGLLFLVLGGLVAVAPTPAEASCAVEHNPVADAATVPVVFTGTVQSVVAQARRSRFIQAVAVDHIYKGSVTTTSVRVRTEPFGSSPRGDQCGAGELTVGTRYLFEVSPDGDTWHAAGHGSATPATDALLAQVATVTGPGAAPPTTPSTPASVTYTQVGSAHPHRLSRVAAPGVALIIVGLLGLVVVRRLGH